MANAILAFLKKKGSIIDPTGHPIPEGVLELEAPAPDGKRLETGTLSYSLGELGKDYVLIECAEIELRCSRLNRHPIHDYVDEFPDHYVVEIFLEDPLVHRPDFAAQHHIYYLCPHDFYPQLRDFIASSVFVDAFRKIYWFPLINHLMVLEPGGREPFPFCYFGLITGRTAFCLRGMQAGIRSHDPILGTEVDVYRTPLQVHRVLLEQDSDLVQRTKKIVEPVFRMKGARKHG